jgi:hypothetical protein
LSSQVSKNPIAPAVPGDPSALYLFEMLSRRAIVELPSNSASMIFPSGLMRKMVGMP